MYICKNSQWTCTGGLPQLTPTASVNCSSTCSHFSSKVVRDQVIMCSYFCCSTCSSRVHEVITLQTQFLGYSLYCFYIDNKRVDAWFRASLHELEKTHTHKPNDLWALKRAKLSLSPLNNQCQPNTRKTTTNQTSSCSIVLISPSSSVLSQRSTVSHSTKRNTETLLVIDSDGVL